MKFLKLNNRDNVAVVLSDPDNNIPTGHKVALKPIQAGAAVVKYWYSIGNASCDIAEGDWVHEHNVVTYGYFYHNLPIVHCQQFGCEYSSSFVLLLSTFSKA